jgi:hypothetical protein
MRLSTLLVLILVCAAAGCADNPQDRGPWHQWLHTQGWE